MLMSAFAAWRHPSHNGRPVNVLYGVESMEVAGAERVVLSLIQGLDRSRFRPMICCLTERGELADRAEALGVPVVALGKSPHFDWPVLPKLVSLLRRREITIVHTHVWPANVWLRVAARLAGVPVAVVTEHTVPLWKRRPQLLVDRWLAGATGRIICVAEAVRDFYRTRVGIAAEKLTRIHNGVMLEPFQELPDPSQQRTALGVDPRSRVLLAVGRLLPEKGHRYLLEALTRLRERHPRTVLLVAGEGPLRGELERASRAAGLNGSVRFLGNREDIPCLLLAADVLVLPSLREGLPLVVLEAMAAAKPVVVSDVGGTREAVVDGVTGLLVPPADPSALASALSVLLADPAKAQAMGREGRRRVEREFSAERMVREVERVYEEELARSGRRS
jgi:glycosyltransferase involved in cell wall biosynthesis